MDKELKYIVYSLIVAILLFTSVVYVFFGHMTKTDWMKLMYSQNAIELTKKEINDAYIEIDSTDIPFREKLVNREVYINIPQSLQDTLKRNVVLYYKIDDRTKGEVAAIKSSLYCLHYINKCYSSRVIVDSDGVIDIMFTRQKHPEIFDLNHPENWDKTLLKLEKHPEFRKAIIVDYRVN